MQGCVGLSHFRPLKQALIEEFSVPSLHGTRTHMGGYGTALAGPEVAPLAAPQSVEQQILKGEDIQTHSRPDFDYGQLQ